MDYVQKNTLRERKENGSLELIPLNCDLSKIGNYGIGIELYFVFLKKASLIFFLMFLIAIPSLVCNITGNGVYY